MKSLVIGAAGFVGSYLIRHLKQGLGHQVAATKMPQEQIYAKAFGTCGMDVFDLNIYDPNIYDPDVYDLDIYDLDIYDLDILDQDALLELLQVTHPDYVFHLAAQSSVAIAWKDPRLTVDVNIQGAVNVLEGLRRLDWRPRLLLVGSGEEYGFVQPGEIPIREDNRIHPGNIYAATKACQNMLGSIYARAYGLEVMMVRAFNHIGPNQDPIFVVADFCRQAARIEAGQKEAVMRVGNLDVRRDFTDVRDVVRAYAMLAERGKAGETYNVGSGKAVRIADILQMILKSSTADIRVETDTSRLRPVDLPVIEADIRKLKETTGWRPSIPLGQTIEETLNYWRRRVRNCKTTSLPSSADRS